MDYKKATIEDLLKEEEKAQKRFEEIQDQCVKEGKSFDEFCELAKDEREKLYLISKHKRLRQDPIIEYGKEWKGTLYTLEEFKKLVMDGALTDTDGSGLYATETSTSDVEIVPSDVEENLIREDFSHVMWFNK